MKIEKKTSFDNHLQEYNRWRPTYSPEVFSTICDYSNIKKNSVLVEVGCGTGQATVFFLDYGCNVIGVESGTNFTNFLRNKFVNYKNFYVYNMDFENYSMQSGVVDLIYAATSFHWVNEDIGYKKAFDLLKSGGSIALFWNTPFVNRNDDMLHQDIQKIYRKYTRNYKAPIEIDEEKYKKRKQTIEKYGFVNVKSILFHQTRTFKAHEYIALLNTYSDHIEMMPDTKRAFESEIYKAIIKGGDRLVVYDTIDLYLAKKP